MSWSGFFRLLGKGRHLLLTVAAVYFAFLSWSAIRILHPSAYYPNLRTFFQMLQAFGAGTHTVGVISLVLLALIYYVPDKDMWAGVLKYVQNSRKGRAPTWSGTLSSREVEQRLREFSQDAQTIDIFAGGADFLSEGDPQHDEVLGYGAKCRILLRKDYAVDSLTLHGLIENGLQARVVPSDRPDSALRGRLKHTAYGQRACLFHKKGERYDVLEIEDTLLVEILNQRYLTLFSDGRNPLIRHIIFDLAGTYFTGDFQDFLNEVGRITGSRIPNRQDNYLCVDEGLNLGSITILQYVQDRLGKSLSEGEAREVESRWGETWKTNPGLEQLALELRERGYKVSAASNCDKANADKYWLTHRFDAFDHVYLSCDLGLVKPDPRFFQHILHELDAHPFECFYFDDHQENLHVAERLGLTASFVSTALTPEERANAVRRALRAAHVDCGDCE